MRSLGVTLRPERSSEPLRRPRPAKTSPKSVPSTVLSSPCRSKRRNRETDNPHRGPLYVLFGSLQRRLMDFKYLRPCLHGGRVYWVRGRDQLAGDSPMGTMTWWKT